MADLRAIGSEKLTGQAKINRIMEIARYGEAQKNVHDHTTSMEFNKKGADGKLYAIVHEKDGYYLKTGLNESTLDYLDGLPNKRKNRFKSYSAALRRLNLIFKPLNEEYNDGKQISMYEQPVTPPDEVGEQEKFVLNVPTEDDDAAPVEDIEVSDEIEVGDDLGDEDMEFDEEGEDMEVEDEEGEDMEVEDEEAVLGDFMKPIQKLTGKLGQKLRDIEEELGSDDIKYVINSILSALDLDSLSEEDKEEIVERFESEEIDDYGVEGDMEMGDEEMMDMEMGDEDMEMGDEEVDTEEEFDLDLDEGKSQNRKTLKERVENTIKSYFKETPKEKNNKIDSYISKKLKESRKTQKLKESFQTLEQELAVKRIMKGSKVNFSHVERDGGIILESKVGTFKVNKKGKLIKR